MSLFVNFFYKKTPYDLESLAEILDAAYSSVKDTSEFITKERFSPSTIGYGSGTCPRRWVLAFRGAEFVNGHTGLELDNMTAGTDAHERIQKNLKESGLDVIIEQELNVTDPPIRGYVDVIIKNHNGYNIVIEIKTTRTEAWTSRRLKNKGPDYQILQLLIYLYYLNERYGVLLYEDKNDHQKIMIPVEMTDHNRAEVEKAIEWMKKVHKTFQDGILPKKPFKSNSKICKTCPLQNWCYSQPEGDTEVEVLKYEL